MFLFQIYYTELSHTFLQWHFNNWVTGFSCALPLKQSQRTIIYAFRHLPKKMTSEIHWVVSQIVHYKTYGNVNKAIKFKIKRKKMFWIFVLYLYSDILVLHPLQKEHEQNFPLNSFSVPTWFSSWGRPQSKPKLFPKNDFLERFAYNHMYYL